MIKLSKFCGKKSFFLNSLWNENQSCQASTSRYKYSFLSIFLSKKEYHLPPFNISSDLLEGLEKPLDIHLPWNSIHLIDYPQSMPKADALPLFHLISKMPLIASHYATISFSCTAIKRRNVHPWCGTIETGFDFSAMSFSGLMTKKRVSRRRKKRHRIGCSPRRFCFNFLIVIGWCGLRDKSHRSSWEPRPSGKARWINDLIMDKMVLTRLTSGLFRSTSKFKYWILTTKQCVYTTLDQFGQ